MADADLKALTAKAKYLKNRWPIYADIIDWLVDLLSETYSVEERLCLPQTPWNHNRLSSAFVEENRFSMPGPFQLIWKVLGISSPPW